MATDPFSREARSDLEKLDPALRQKVEQWAAKVQPMAKAPRVYLTEDLGDVKVWYMILERKLRVCDVKAAA